MLVVKDRFKYDFCFLSYIMHEFVAEDIIDGFMQHAAIAVAAPQFIDMLARETRPTELYAQLPEATIEFEEGGATYSLMLRRLINNEIAGNYRPTWFQSAATGLAPRLRRYSSTVLTWSACMDLREQFAHADMSLLGKLQSTEENESGVVVTARPILYIPGSDPFAVRAWEEKHTQYGSERSFMGMRRFIPSRS
jgi:hypothetical protein